MKWTQQELSHLVFLSQVILDGNKKTLMPDALRSLLFVAKSLQEVEISAEIADELERLNQRMEEQLRVENDRIQEIMENLDQPAYQRRYGRG